MRAHAGAGRRLALAVEVDAALGALVDHRHARLLDLLEPHARLGERDLFGQGFEELVDRAGLAQVDGRGQADVVERAQELPQRRVHLRFGARRLQRVAVLHAAALGQLDRHEEQGRGDRLLRRLLEIAPAKEAGDEAKLREAVFLPVLARLRADLVERRRGELHLLEAQELRDLDFLALDQPVRDPPGAATAVPGEELLGPDGLDAQDDRHRSLGQVQLVRARLVVDQLVAPREIVEPAAQLGEDLLAAAQPFLRTRFGQDGRARLAMVLQAVDQARQVLRALAPVDLGHARQQLRGDRVQARIALHEVLANLGEGPKVAVFGEVEAAGQTDAEHPEAEDVGQRVVMPDRMLPRAVVGQIDRLVRRDVARADA